MPKFDPFSMWDPPNVFRPAVSDLIESPADEAHIRQRAIAQIPPPTAIPADHLYTLIIRPPFEEDYEIVFLDGTSEQLDQASIFEWFRERGANMDAAEKAINHAWNFYRAEFVFKGSKRPISSPVYAPNI